MALKHVRIEICWGVLHGSRGGRGSVGVGRACARGHHGGGGFEDLVLGADLLQVALEALVLGEDFLLCLFELLDAVFEVFDVAFFALAEGSLAGRGLVWYV